MKLCIPVASPEGLESKLAADFGAARHLLILDSESQQFEALDRAEPSTIAQSSVAEIRGVLCSEMHPHLLLNLQKNGIQVFGCEAETAAEALAQFLAGELEAVPELPSEMLDHAGGCGCGGHGRGEGGGCGSHEQDACGCQHDDPDHECCGGKGHDDPDHECCGGKGHGAGQHGGGCGCGH